MTTTQERGVERLINISAQQETSVDKNSLLEEECGFCGKVLEITQDLYDKVQRVNDERRQKRDSGPHRMKGQHDEVYVSGGGYFYCNSDCFVAFTED